jgi:hypothetical protein
MPLREALRTTLTHPTPENLWSLRAELLEAGVPTASRIWAVIGQYQLFLEQVRTGAASRHYSELASKLDIGSISGVLLERFLEPETARELTLSLISGILSEGLMVAATRQHVKAWEEGMGSVCAGAAWFLYEELWRWAQEKKPELPAAERRRLLDFLFAPVCSRESAGLSKPVLLGALFQLLLVSGAAEELGRLAQTGK